jgi:nucleoside-diphosphate-sugar epimerase
MSGSDITRFLMRIFVTGASGHIGSAVVPELLAAGHQVTGLARSEASAALLTAAGAVVRRGTLDDLGALQKAVTESDGVIHLAFKHDVAFSGGYATAASDDLRAIEAMGAALEGSGKPFVGTAGSLALSFSVRGRSATEADVLDSGPRIDAENTVIGLARRGVRSSVIRLAPTVHSSLDLHGFLPTLIALARKNGFAAYVGNGSNRWPALHTLDAARLYRLALEVGPAGSRLHGVADEGVAFREIAEAIGRGLGLPAASVSAAEAEKHLGFLASFAQRDNPTSSEHTRSVLGWQPTHPGLLADLTEGHYFARIATDGL